MRQKIKKILDPTLWKFILVGVVNTAIGTAVMFVFYNFFHCSYWVSTASNYIVGSVVSYFLNKNFTFRNKNKGVVVVLKFTANILVCYLLAYGIARPLIRCLFADFGKSIQDNLAMVTGMGVFIVFNYIGQRFWAFKE